MINRIDCHNHTVYSNLRGLDSINQVKDLIKKAQEIGLKGIAITDHGNVSSHYKVNKIQQELIQQKSDFKCILGEEAYLVKNKENTEKYFHYILLAKDEIGYQQLRRISTIENLTSSFKKGIERVCITYDEIENIIGNNKGHLIATNACVGGFIGYNLLEYKKNKQIGNDAAAEQNIQDIDWYINWNKTMFNDDFYLELDFGYNEEQKYVSQQIIELSKKYNIKAIVNSDSHYLNKEDLIYEEAFLQSQQIDREVKEFYSSTYLHNEEEAIEELKLCGLEQYFETLAANSMEIYDKIKVFDLSRPQQIPYIEVDDFPKKVDTELTKYPVLHKMFESDDIFDRYWINTCINKLKELGYFNDEYLTQLEEEADIKRVVGERLHTNMYRYPVLLHRMIDRFWELGATIGVSRGSAMAGLNHYLLGLVSINPVKEKMAFFWRYMNRDTEGLGDLDTDIASSMMPTIIKDIKEQRQKYLDKDLYDIELQNLGCAYCATFMTLSSKAAIKVACRGLGISDDISAYLASLVTVSRGKSASIQELLYGIIDEETGEEIKPNKLFINEVRKYEGLEQLLIKFQGLVTNKSRHASGVILNQAPLYDWAAFMKTSKGEVIFQWDLHDCEAMSGVKLDLLVTDVMDKIKQSLLFIQDEGIVDKNLTLRQIYNKILHPDVLDTSDSKVWQTICDNKVNSLFQFEKSSGAIGIAQTQPRDIPTLSNTNGLIRLTAEKGQERPMDKYLRLQDPNLQEAELNKYNLTQKEKEAFRKYLSNSHMLGIDQENLMLCLQDPELCGFTLRQANKARKIVSKKKMEEIPKLKQAIFESAKSQNAARYLWDNVIGPQKSYAFSCLHATGYAYIAFQTAYMATYYPLEWNAACLCVDSGSLTEEESGGKDYAKISGAINKMRKNGVNISLPNINSSDFSFKPDQEHNRIIYGLNGVTRVNAEVIAAIKSGRPYKDIKDFMYRCKIGKLPMINLIKSGAFDELDTRMNRFDIMAYYISEACEPKKKLTMQNFNGLAENNCLPQELDFERKVFNYNKYLKKFCQKGDIYEFDDRAAAFFENNFKDDLDKLSINGHTTIQCDSWKNIYDNVMNKAKAWIKSNQEQALKELNYKLFSDMWNKYNPINNLAAWEMESVCFYQHEHELANVDKELYGITDFEAVVENDVAYNITKGNAVIPIYNLSKIIGTAISKNDTSHTVTILTPLGSVVTVKMAKDLYSLYKVQIKQDGHIVQKGWFTKGNKLLFMGYKKDENNFVCKNYKKTNSHQIYMISDIKEDRQLELVHERPFGEQVEGEEENE